ncbi:disrupted in renal carcinoma protein 2 isoform X2 [Biomphalaria pfeifferi]|uniref:Disrupted in renal carcinoma protein 2 isoform X2 n=1 Tax=Biomphalaria pfeifferi TaxID=112525 RepID=A0AAD8C7V9_BIOPF|nr:disrupted in renal carcinoma protein 2 isoform X2 [Biomphalaria pfeifferi]
MQNPSYDADLNPGIDQSEEELNTRKKKNKLSQFNDASLKSSDKLKKSLDTKAAKDSNDDNTSFTMSDSETALDGQLKNDKKNVSKLQHEFNLKNQNKDNASLPDVYLEKSPDNTDKIMDYGFKKWTNGETRELTSPISFVNSEYLSNGPSIEYRTGHQSVPIFSHKSYVSSEVKYSQQQAGSFPYNSGKKSSKAANSNHVLKRVVGKEAIDLFYQQKLQRPSSAAQFLKDSTNVNNKSPMTVQLGTGKYGSDNMLPMCQNSLYRNEKDSSGTISKVVSINPTRNNAICQEDTNSITSVKLLEAISSVLLDTGSSQGLEDSVLQSQSEENSEKTPLLNKSKTDSRTYVYAKRWYLLLLFSITAMLWSAVWSTWGPIAQSAKDVFGWDDGVIAMMTWLGNIPFLVTMFPIAYLMDVKGMRIAMILCCGLIFLGAGLRCIPCDNATATWLIYGGQLLNGIAGTVPMSGSALLSGLWFPSNQRASATAISTISGYLGASVSFVIGPLFVPEDDSSGNETTGIISSNSSDSDITDQKSHIYYILYAECGAAGLILLLVLLYFPSKPELPPSISASIPREKYLDGLKMLVRNKQFWITAIAFSFPAGVYEAWQVVLDVNLDPKVSQSTAGWMDFYATVGGCCSGMLVSRFADYFTRQIKLFLLVFYFLAAIVFLWCTFIVTDILPFDIVSLYAAIILGGVFLDGGGPLFFELVVEVSYPVGEGVTSGCVQMICSLAGIIFLSLVQVSPTDKQWMNWCFFSVIAMAIPLLFLVKANYGRADVDDLEVSVEEETQSVNP